MKPKHPKQTLVYFFECNYFYEIKFSDILLRITDPVSAWSLHMLKWSAVLCSLFIQVVSAFYVVADLLKRFINDGEAAFEPNVW